MMMFIERTGIVASWRDAILNPPIESSCHQFQHVLRDIWLEIRVFQSRVLQREAFLMFRRLRLWIKWHTVPPNRKPISFAVRHAATIS